jgi:hypothetical protein
VKRRAAAESVSLISQMPLLNLDHNSTELLNQMVNTG